MIGKEKIGPIRAAAGRSLRKTGWLFIVLVLAILIAAWFTGPVAETASAGKPEKQSQVQIDFKYLEGRWVRPDGGYILELRNIKKDGSVTAAYYNPRPIKVYRAELSQKEGKISLMVELRDVNYPGSTYDLRYDPANDRLKGTYFQAVERQTFNIEFVRVR